MWQNETEQQNVQLFPPQPPLKDILRYKPGPHDTGVSPVLKTQVALCLLLLGVVLALRLLNLPVYEYFRQQYEQSLSQEGEFFREKELFALADGFLEGLRERAEGAVSAWEDRVQGEEAPDSIDGQGQPAPLQAAGWEGFSTRNLPEGCSLKCLVPEGELVCPLESYTITSEYGWRKDPITGKKGDFHKGIDMAAGEGASVYTPLDGWVERVRADSTGGNFVLLRHEDGYSTRYCHMQYIFVRVGEWVEAGQILGTVGQTGQATGPHLHWEIIYENTRYDPSEALGLSHTL